MGGGGAERIMSHLLALSDSRREYFDIRLALLDRAVSAYPIPDWVKVHQLDCRGSFSASVRQMRDLVCRLQPVVRLSFLTRANIASGLAGGGLPWLISERVNTAAHLGGRPYGFISRLLVRLTYPRAHHIVAVSQGVADGLVEQFAVCPSRITVIGNPIDIAAIRSQGAGPNPFSDIGPYIVAVGRLTRNKNFSMLIRAFSKADLPAKLVIAGEGEEQLSLQAVAAELGIADRVVFPGFLPNPYATVRHAELFALSSNSEGFPNALVEAMALGVPTVATNCADGPAEILAGKSRDEVHGVVQASAGILSPADNVDEFARALRMGFDPSIRKRIVQGASQRVEDFAPDIAVERYWSVIEGALSKSV